MNSQQSNGSILRAVDLSKEYVTGALPLHVLKNVKIDITPHVIMTIVGASGAGKSTLLHILGALDRPTSGTVYYHGRNLYGISDRRRTQIRNSEFGFVFQFYHLMPEFTALENVLLPCLVARSATADSREWARELLDAVGLADRAGHFPNQLSGGEQQRVAIARALMNKPGLVFADEPTGNLDRQSSDLVIDLLLKLHEQHAFALVMVTHNVELAQLGSCRLHLKDGVLTDVSAA